MMKYWVGYLLLGLLQITAAGGYWAKMEGLLTWVSGVSGALLITIGTLGVIDWTRDLFK
jgi:hypothetical protein